MMKELMGMPTDEEREAKREAEIERMVSEAVEHYEAMGGHLPDEAVDGLREQVEEHLEYRDRQQMLAEMSDRLIREAAGEIAAATHGTVCGCGAAPKPEHVVLIIMTRNADGSPAIGTYAQRGTRAYDVAALLRQAWLNSEEAFRMHQQLDELVAGEDG